MSGEEKKDHRQYRRTATELASSQRSGLFLQVGRETVFNTVFLGALETHLDPSQVIERIGSHPTPNASNRYSVSSRLMIHDLGGHFAIDALAPLEHRREGVPVLRRAKNCPMRG